MLTNLHVKNLALIKEADIDFQKGLNILTGETGAGKSIILGSVNIALGGKVTGDIIRKGCDYALTELTFHLTDPNRLALLAKMDLTDLEEGTVIITRKILPGRSQSKVNGQTMTISQVKEIAALLIDIHGQRDNQSLLEESSHLKLIDAFCEEDRRPVCRKLKELCQQYQDCLRREASLGGNEESRLREISFLEFEVNEIANASLQEGEDDQLEEDFRRMSNAQSIAECLSLIDQQLVSGETNISDAVSSSIHAASKACEYDKDLESVLTSLQDMESIASDVARELDSYQQNTQFDQEALYETQQRLDLINTLKSKYGNSISSILGTLEQKQTHLQDLKDYASLSEKLQDEKKQLEKQILSSCDKLTAIRKKAADQLCARIIEALHDLNFLDVRFETSFEKTSHFTPNGNDLVRFMISTNPGEDLKPLAKIASGGEMSRIMLAVKAVLAREDQIETLIFDEIDAGISGRTAQMVGQKMAQLAESHQIICITHLPQIAAMADAHYVIEKEVLDASTQTEIRKLDDTSSIEELSRLLGGSRITETVQSNAREMKAMAASYKKCLHSDKN